MLLFGLYRYDFLRMSYYAHPKGYIELWRNPPSYFNLPAWDEMNDFDKQ